MDTRVKTLIAFGAALAVVVAAILIARGGGDSGGGSGADTSTTATEKPKVEVPDTPPPKTLQVKDLKTGEGDAAKAGDQISVQYVGVDYDTGKEFDASYDRGQPFDLQLGAGSVIPGWDKGIVGMKVGGRRQLTIPPDLAYGKQGQPPAIGPNATLVFVIDLVSIN